MLQIQKQRFRKIILLTKGHTADGVVESILWTEINSAVSELVCLGHSALLKGIVHLLVQDVEFNLSSVCLHTAIELVIHIIMLQ